MCGPPGWKRRSFVTSEVNEFRVVLTVDDFDRAVAFYRDALGLALVEDWSSDTGRVVLLAAGPATLELMDEAQARQVDMIEVGQRVSGSVRFALEVADSEETATALVAAGATEVAPPVVTPWGDRNARVEAPDGMQLTLFSPVGLA
jgi:methylmalonyl-CoA/ethylmalonyl-CoA epimerase